MKDNVYMKRVRAAMLAAITAASLAACSTGNKNIDTAEANTTSAAQTAIIQASALQATELLSQVADTVDVEFSEEDNNADYDPGAATTIYFEGSTASVSGEGATAQGSLVTVSAAGLYEVSGKTDDGQIIVDCTDKGTIRLVLNSADITCLSGAPVYIINAEKVIITLKDGTDNTLTGKGLSSDTEEDETCNAAIYSKEDLTINGTGSLTINSDKNGINVRDGLKITNAAITVNAESNGIKGKNYIAVMSGSITVSAGNDGLRATDANEDDKGFINISGGTFDITAGGDGIEAKTNILISGGEFSINSGGGSETVSNTSRNNNFPGNNTQSGEDEASAKGIKALVNLSVTGGAFDIDAADDALHSNGSIIVQQADMELATGDDGIHADESIIISGGTINILKSYEGIESSDILISGGELHIASDDDGINIAGGNDNSGMGGWRGQDQFQASSDSMFTVSGGYTYVDAGGDGIDVSCSILMTGGTIIVNGPTDNGNGALDYTGTFDIEGGLFIAAGSSGMAMAPSTSSSQYSMFVNFDSAQAADTLVQIKDESGEGVLVFAPAKKYQSLVISSPDLKAGQTYDIILGGASSGSEIDGLYTDGTVSGGQQAASLTLSSVVTSYGSAGSFGGGMQGGGMPGGGMHGRG